MRMCKLVEIDSWRESSQIATNRMSISDSQYQRHAQGLDKVGHDLTSIFYNLLYINLNIHQNEKYYILGVAKSND